MTTEDQRVILVTHAEMILRASDESVPEKNDRLDAQAAFDLVLRARQDNPHRESGSLL